MCAWYFNECALEIAFSKINAIIASGESGEKDSEENGEIFWKIASQVALSAGR